MYSHTINIILICPHFKSHENPQSRDFVILTVIDVFVTNIKFLRGYNVQLSVIHGSRRKLLK